MPLFPVRTAQEVRVKNMNFEILHRKFQLRLLRRLPDRLNQSINF